MELEYTAQRSGRLSGFLRGELRLSAGLMNRLKWQNALCVNGRPVHTDFPVSPGDRITVRLEEPVPDYPPEHLPLRVIYEDEQLLVVDKPPGMLIHPSRHRNTGTLANRVLAYYQATGQPCAFHPVTRLDRDTFGLVLLAKNSHIHHLLNDSHMAGELEKTYEALVYGVPPVFSGRVDAPIARLPLPSLLRKIDPAGQSATTLYQVQTTGPAGAGCACKPSPAAPISSGSTAPIWAAQFWATPSTPPGKAPRFPTNWAFKLSSFAPFACGFPTP